MRSKSLTVNQHMTHVPIEGERCATVAEAQALMNAHNIRHLPVMSGLQLKGIISLRHLQELRGVHGDKLDQMLPEDICERDVVTVGPLTPVSQVAERMLERRVGSVVGVDGEYVVGMFTTTDAIDLLRQLTS